MHNRRKRLTVAERLEPCECCGHKPIEHHHVLHFADYPKANLTIALCPNCHALYHIFESANGGNRDNKAVLDELMRDGAFDARILFLGRLWKDAAALGAETKRVAAEMAANPQRLFSMLRAGKSIEEINTAYGYLDNVEFEQLG